MNNESSYLKAQKQYDAQLPPSCEDEEDIEEERSRREAYEAWQESKADEAREERLIELSQNAKVGSDIDRFLDKREGD